MHTTEEAKQLWCPIGRVGVLPQSGGPAGVNDPGTEFRINCQGEQCAMWRVGYTPDRRVIYCDEYTATVEPKRPEKVPESFGFCPWDETEGESAHWIEPEHMCKQRRRGFCGLAGVPA